MASSGVVIHRRDTAPSHRSRTRCSARTASSGCVRRRRFARVSQPHTSTPCRSTTPSSAKQGLSPAPARRSICPRRNENRSHVHPVSGMPAAAQTRRGVSARAFSAVNTPPEYAVTTAGASASRPAQTRSVCHVMRARPAHSMSSTRASASSGTNAVTRTDIPSTVRSHAAQPKPYSTRACPSSSKSDTVPARVVMRSVSVPRSTHGSHSQRLMRPVCALRYHRCPVPASVARKPKRPFVSTLLHARGGSPVKATVPSASQCTSLPVGIVRRSPGGGSSGSVQRVCAMPGRMAAAAATSAKASSGTRCTPPGASRQCARSSAASAPRTFARVGWR